jgi:hypothetical protein
MKIVHEAELNMSGFVKKMSVGELPLRLNTRIEIPNYATITETGETEYITTTKELRFEFRLDAITTVEVRNMGLYTAPYILKTGHYTLYKQRG